MRDGMKEKIESICAEAAKTIFEAYQRLPERPSEAELEDFLYNKMRPELDTAGDLIEVEAIEARSRMS